MTEYADGVFAIDRTRPKSIAWHIDNILLSASIVNTLRVGQTCADLSRHYRAMEADGTGWSVSRWWRATNTTVGVSILAVAALFILTPIATKTYHNEYLRGHPIIKDDTGPALVVNEVLPYRMIGALWARSYTSEFMHPGESQILKAIPAWHLVKREDVLAETYFAHRRNADDLSCKLFAPSFETAALGTLNRCEFVITPREKHIGSQVVVYSMYDAGHLAISGYRVINVGENPFSIANISTSIGVLTAAAALLLQLVGKGPAIKDETKKGAPQPEP